MLYSCLCYIAYMLYSLLCYIACMLYSTRQGVICIRCYIASYMATTKVPDEVYRELYVVTYNMKAYNQGAFISHSQNHAAQFKFQGKKITARLHLQAAAACPLALACRSLLRVAESCPQF